MVLVELQNPEQIEQSIAQTVKSDNEAVLSQLPAMLNREFRPSKWFNRVSGDLESETAAVREGKEVNIYSSPIGAAFDISGGGELGWSSVTAYMKARAGGGYMRDYMRQRREGMLKTGKITGKKHIPFLLKATYKIDKLIQMILSKEAAGVAA